MKKRMCNEKMCNEKKFSITEFETMILADFQKELLDNARNNWCKSQVEMLEALIVSTCTGIDYADVFDKLKESEAE